VIELIQNLFRKITAPSESSLFGLSPLNYSVELQKIMFEDSNILDFFIICFRVFLFIDYS